MTKDCEGCGAEGAPHVIRHVLRRLPRVLVLHLKRFQVRLGNVAGYNTKPLNDPRSTTSHVCTLESRAVGQQNILTSRLFLWMGRLAPSDPSEQRIQTRHDMIYNFRRIVRKNTLLHFILIRPQVSFSSGGAPHFSKVNSPVAAERMLRVGALTDAATRPPLLLGASQPEGLPT